MRLQSIIQNIRDKNSFLCVGLDSDMDRLPISFNKNLDGIVEFNKAIIEATSDYCVAYKINTAFYERYGSKGWKALEKTRKLLPKSHFLIADAKRGDIGNTATQYAEAFFNHLNFDAVTVAPYMGRDSIDPFLSYKGKWAILLGITSNPGSADFQKIPTTDGSRVYEKVMEKAVHWGPSDQMMFVCGATQSEELSRARAIAPQHFFLVPGIGHQGGSLKEVGERCLNENVGVLVNSSRGIIFASSGKDFQEAAAKKAAELSNEMATFL